MKQNSIPLSISNNGYDVKLPKNSSKFYQNLWYSYLETFCSERNKKKIVFHDLELPQEDVFIRIANRMYKYEVYGLLESKSESDFGKKEVKYLLYEDDMRGLRTVCEELLIDELSKKDRPYIETGGYTFIEDLCKEGGWTNRESVDNVISEIRRITNELNDLKDDHDDFERPKTPGFEFDDEDYDDENGFLLEDLTPKKRKMVREYEYLNFPTGSPGALTIEERIVKRKSESNDTISLGKRKRDKVKKKSVSIGTQSTIKSMVVNSETQTDDLTQKKKIRKIIHDLRKMIPFVDFEFEIIQTKNCTDDKKREIADVFGQKLEKDMNRMKAEKWIRCELLKLQKWTQNQEKRYQKLDKKIADLEIWQEVELEPLEKEFNLLAKLRPAALSSKLIRERAYNYYNKIVLLMNSKECLVVNLVMSEVSGPLASCLLVFRENTVEVKLLVGKLKDNYINAGHELMKWVIRKVNIRKELLFLVSVDEEDTITFYRDRCGMVEIQPGRKKYGKLKLGYKQILRDYRNDLNHGSYLLGMNRERDCFSLPVFVYLSREEKRKKIKY